MYNTQRHPCSSFLTLLEKHTWYLMTPSGDNAPHPHPPVPIEAFCSLGLDPQTAFREGEGPTRASPEMLLGPDHQKAFWMLLSSVWSTCASSCGEPGDLSGKTHARTCDTGKACVRCVCGSDGSARPIWRTSSRSLPSCSGRASHLRDVSKTLCLDCSARTTVKRKGAKMLTIALCSEMCLPV